jgi:hypothetical protein
MRSSHCISLCCCSELGRELASVLAIAADARCAVLSRIEGSATRTRPSGKSSIPGQQPNFCNLLGRVWGHSLPMQTL